MRKFFASAFGLTATLAIVAGLVFAWTGSDDIQALQTSTGSVSITAVQNSGPGPALLPGASSVQAGGYITNNTGVPVYISGGNIVSVATNPVGGCAGWVDPQSVVVTDSSSVGPGGSGGAWQAWLGLHSATPDVCQSQAVDFVVRIFAST